MPLPTLTPDHLVVLVFGPGLGELILVRVPPGLWVVVDGCGAKGIDYAAAVLHHYGDARPAVVVLTHPHDDHSRGIADVIRKATPNDRKDQWPRVGMVLPPGDDVALRSDGFIAAVTLDAIAAVEDRWKMSPECRWEMHAGDSERVGDATLRALSPARAVRDAQLARWSAREPFDKNTIASALLLTWRGRRVLLGSDLVEDPGAGWTTSLQLDPELGDHELLKVPHHGSDKALHDDVLRPRARVPEPFRVLAPFSKQRLPSFKAGVGVPRILSHGGTTYLTGLPRRHDQQSARVEARTLAELATHSAIIFDPKTTGFPDCYVLVSILPDVGAPVVTQGPGSIRVVP